MDLASLRIMRGRGRGRIMRGRGRGIPWGRVTVYLHGVYSGIYAQDRGGAFLWRVYMADFKG